MNAARSGPPISRAPLTPEMERVLTIIRDRGMAVAGKGEHAGHVERIAASTLDALARRGLVTLCYSGDGGMAARLA